MWCQVAPGPPWRQRSGSLPGSSASPTTRYQVRNPANGTNPSLTGSVVDMLSASYCEVLRRSEPVSDPECRRPFLRCRHGEPCLRTPLQPPPLPEPLPQTPDFDE